MGNPFSSDPFGGVDPYAPGGVFFEEDRRREAMLASMAAADLREAEAAERDRDAQRRAAQAEFEARHPVEGRWWFLKPGEVGQGWRRGEVIERERRAAPSDSTQFEPLEKPPTGMASAIAKASASAEIRPPVDTPLPAIVHERTAPTSRGDAAVRDYARRNGLKRSTPFLEQWSTTLMWGIGILSLAVFGNTDSPGLAFVVGPILIAAVWGGAKYQAHAASEAVVTQAFNQLKAEVEATNRKVPAAEEARRATINRNREARESYKRALDERVERLANEWRSSPPDVVPAGAGECAACGIRVRASFVLRPRGGGALTLGHICTAVLFDDLDEQT